jgi:hypothetical protein
VARTYGSGRARRNGSDRPGGTSPGRCQPRRGTITTSERLRRVDPYDRTYELDLCYDLVHDGEVVRTEFRRLVSRWYAPPELTAMLETAGFVDVRVSNAFTDDPADARVGVYSYLARRAT